MAVTLIGSGGLYTRIGLLFGRIADVLAVEGGTATARVLSTANMVTTVKAVEAAYAAGTALYPPVDGVWSEVGSWQGAQGAYLKALANRVQNTIIQQVDADEPLGQQRTLAAALAILIRQMQTSVDSVQASTPAAGAQTAVGSPVGDAKILVSVKRGDGLLCEYALAETLKFACTADSQGSATLNGEPFGVTGKAAVADGFSYLWPGGSGVSKSLNAVDATLNNSGGNLLQNSEFLTATTANNPDNWTITVGAAGTTVFQAASGFYDGYSLQFTGDGGGTLMAVTQTFNTTPSTVVGNGGTAATLKPLTQYGYNFWIKVSATPTAGVMEISLIDGSGTTINDAAGTANLRTRVLTTPLSTTYTNVQGTFRTPAALPSAVKLKIRLSTAIDSGKSMFLDRLSFTEMSNPLYAGGPVAAVFSGATKVIRGDSWTISVTNTFGAFQAMMERCFGMRNLGLMLPSAGSPTVSDALIA